MNHPEADPTPTPTARPTTVGDALLATATAAGGALAGGGLMSVVASIGLLIPLIPGAVVGYAVDRVCRSSSLLIACIAGVFGFASVIFGYALVYDLVEQPGTWYYITHFWKAADPLTVVFWLLNVVIAFWMARRTPSLSPSVQIRPAAQGCPGCGQPNPANARFCAGCGKRMHPD